MFLITGIYGGCHLWYGLPSTQQTLAHTQDQNRGLQRPFERCINPPFWHVIPTFPERAWGGIRARLSVPNRTKTQPCYQSIEKTGWAEKLYSSLQFNISVNRRWKAKISETCSVCFPVDKSPQGKSLSQFQCLRWLSQHIACQALLIGSSLL